MKKLFLLLGLLLALPAQAADPLPRAAPQMVGLSPAKLDRIRTTLETEVKEGRLPGAVVAIARRGRLAYYEAIGFQDGARTIPMRRDAIFPIASFRGAE